MQSPDRAPDPYALLGISFGATEADIKLAYRRAVQKNHPDRHPHDSTAHQRFVEIQAAYEWIVANPGENPNQPVVPPSQESFSHAPEKPENYRAEGPKEGDVSTLVFVPLQDINEDVQKIVSVKVAVLCPRCHGQRTTCARCLGTGQVLQKKKFRFIIPAGTLDGTWVIGRHLGHEGANKKGDVWVQVKWSKMGVWSWDGSRLTAQLWLSSRQLKKGGQFPLRLPSGNWVWCTIPPHSQSGQIFKWNNLPWSPFSQDAWLQVKQGWSLLSLPSRR